MSCSRACAYERLRLTSAVVRFCRHLVNADTPLWPRRLHLGGAGTEDRRDTGHWRDGRKDRRAREGKQPARAAAYMRFRRVSEVFCSRHVARSDMSSSSSSLPLAGEATGRGGLGRECA